MPSRHWLNASSHLFAVGVLLAAVVGCVKPNEVRCDDGRICPEKTACDDVHALCVDPEQITACDGVADFAECTAVGNGRCYDGVCLQGGCGNARPDPGEMCDDGNTNTGDGCSAECLSTEQCRNGVIDLINDEECDDGNSESHDGCSSNCREETPAWVPHTVFGPRGKPGIAYDSRRARVVLYGGYLSRFAYSDMYEWDGHRWTSIAVGVSPGLRNDTAMAFDEARGVTVMFGGNDGADRNDVWEWDGANWNLRTSLGPPPTPRSGHTLVYDPALEMVVMFGGSSGEIDQNDLWTWDGNTWAQLSATGPTARRHHAMTLDPVRGVLVLFGGLAGSAATPLGDTWELANGTWTQRTVSGPSVGGDALLAFDPVSGQVLMTAQGSSTTTWFLNGQAWTSGPSSQASFAFGAATTDMHRGHVLVVGTAADTWNWTGSTWGRLESTDVIVPGRIKAAAAHDRSRHRVLIYGGVEGTTGSAETFFWDGTARQVTSSSLPSARYSAAMAHDQARDEFVLFGGGAGISTVYGDFYTSPDGVTWTLRPTPPVTPRTGHVMVYDEARQNTVLFGGRTNPGGLVSQTWMWNGSSWTSYTGTQPSAREYPCVAFDPIRQRIVLFGGYDANGIDLGDTWEWDGATWSQIQTLAAPSPRYGCAMAWDAGRRTLVMEGGSNLNSDQTWTWNGTTWTQLLITRPPPPGRNHYMFTSLDGDGVTIHGMGLGEDAFYQLHWQSSSPPEHCGPADGDGDTKAGCADLDCWPSCTALCPPGTSCTSMPSCGDGTCDSIEDCWTCGADCGVCD